MIYSETECLFMVFGEFNHTVEADNTSGNSAAYEGARSLHASYKHMFCIGFGFLHIVCAASLKCIGLYTCFSKCKKLI